MGKTIGFLGLGIMGMGMAGSLLRRGFPVVAWNRDPGKTRALSGASVGESPEDVARRSDVVVSILRDDAVSRELLLERAMPAAKPGTTFVEMTTITPMMAAELARKAKEFGHPFLDAPVTGSKDAAESGQLTALVGGDAATLEAQRDVLAAMAQTIVHVGPNGSSAYLKLGNNLVIGALASALRESLLLCEMGGVDRETALRMYVATCGRVSKMKEEKILARDWSPHFSVDMLLKDLTQAAAVAEDRGVVTPVLDAAKATFESAGKRGCGGLDFSVIVESA